MIQNSAYTAGLHSGYVLERVIRGSAEFDSLLKSSLYPQEVVGSQKDALCRCIGVHVLIYVSPVRDPIRGYESPRFNAGFTPGNF